MGLARSNKATKGLHPWRNMTQVRLNSKDGRNYRVFVGKDAFIAEGNPCYLVFDHKLAERGRLSHGTAQCYVEYSDNLVNVSCFQNGRSIACCGHGLLATGHHYLNLLGRQEITLNMHGDLITAFSERHDPDKVWLRFNPINLEHQDPPAWLNDVFPVHGKHCIAAARTLNDNGYWVLEWPPETLKELVAPDSDLAVLTQRALINTCQIGPATIGMRYFAPQYGNIEDAATGSAMRVVICYWQKNELIAYQLSEQGGLLFGRFEADTQQVSVGGYCRLETGISD